MIEDEYLRDLITLTSARAECIWLKEGELSPVWILIKEDDVTYVPAVIDDKDVMFEAVKAIIDDGEFTHWVFVCEAWMSRRPGTPEDDPDRKEVVNIQASNVETGYRIMATRVIHRDKEMSYLGPLEFGTTVWSRMDNEETRH